MEFELFLMKCGHRLDKMPLFPLSWAWQLTLCGKKRSGNEREERGVEVTVNCPAVIWG